MVPPCKAWRVRGNGSGGVAMWSWKAGDGGKTREGEVIGPGGKYLMRSIRYGDALRVVSCRHRHRWRRAFSSHIPTVMLVGVCT